jgi:hypothetical protein
MEIRWPHLSQAARGIATRWADRPVRMPPAFHLDVIVDRVREEWGKRESLNGLSGRELQWLPHALFHPEADRKAWLANDVEFVGAALGRMRERPRAMRSLLQKVLRLWPKELGAAGRIQEVLKEELRAATSPRLREWHRRVEKYGLLSAEGPPTFADILSADPGRRTQLLEDAGLAGDLAQSAFLSEVDIRLGRLLWEDLAAGRYEKLDAFLPLLAPDGRLTFQTLAPYFAEAVLLPFVNVNPPDEVRAKIQAFLLTHLRDPRLTQSGWTRVNPSAKAVMLRWMVSASLEDFFALIARRAQEDHWRYRQAFWSAYLKHQHIAHAWVVLGDNAELEARRRWRDAMPAHARLAGGDPDHCVLLLQVGNVVIAEWSHNGTCRVWRENDQHCPRLYRHQYSRAELRSNPGYEQRHHGNTNYTWQQTLAGVIRKETGIGVPQVEYRVR